MGWSVNWFETMAEARSVIEAWRRDYNESRPHMGLGHRTPQEHRLLTGGSPSVKAPATAEG